jgi:hypothetical protein
MFAAGYDGQWWVLIVVAATAVAGVHHVETQPP